MNDLRFMIVNSNLLHSQNLIHELKNRVSFEVYQDTEEKNIWGLMQGGKDDLYVYDRCGRLAYYIPFPLSIMSSEESSLVTSAILATYYRSPCGTTCEKNSSTLEDFLNNVDSTESPTTTENNPSTTELYRTIFSSNQSEDLSDLLETNTSSILDSSEMKGNSSKVIDDFDYSIHNKTVLDDFDYPTYDETLEDQSNNATNPKHDNAFFNTLYSLFFKTATTEPPVTENTNETLATNFSSFGIISKSNEIHVPLNLSDADITSSNSNNTEVPSEILTQTPKPKSDRCAEADPSVCKDWSKKRLLRAYNCCQLIEDESPHQPQFCKNFGKKRCKKMRTILKCCIKTALFEVTTESAVATDVAEVAEEEVSTVAAPVTEAKYDIVCCRNVEDGKLCRVSEKPTCELGEYQEESRTRSEDVPLLGRTM